MLISHAIQEFSAWRNLQVKKGTVVAYENDLKAFCVFVRDCDVEHVQLADLIMYLNLLEKVGIKQNTFIVKCMAFRKFFEYLGKRGYKTIDKDLIPLPRKEFEIPRVANEDGYRKLLSAVPENTRDPRHIRNNAHIRLLWDTGARNGEIVALNINDLDFVRRRAVIKTEKNRGSRPIREIYWSEETSEYLKKWIKKRQQLLDQWHSDEQALFVCINNWNSGKRLTVKAVGAFLRNYSIKAGIPPMNAHSMRHHKGHEIPKRGGSAVDVMNILGHATLASSTVYTRMCDKELEERAKKFM